jgi:hypothetical protein
VHTLRSSRVRVFDPPPSPCDGLASPAPLAAAVMPMPRSRPMAVGAAGHADPMERAAVAANVHPLGQGATRRVAVIPAHLIRVATVAPALGAGRRRPRSCRRGGAGAADADNTAQAGRGGHRQHQGETDVTPDRDPQPVVHLYLPWSRGCRGPHGGRAPAARVTAPQAPAPRVGCFGDAEQLQALSAELLRHKPWG